jgi:hypothetical protein
LPSSTSSIRGPTEASIRGPVAAAEPQAETRKRQHPDADRDRQRGGERQLSRPQDSDDCDRLRAAKDFTGVDTLEIEIDVDNRTAVLSHRITVAARPQAQPL